MAINRISGPSSLPTAVGDYQAQNNLLSAGFSGLDTLPWSSTSMQIGAVFQVGGTVYRVDTATSITGTPSAYVKITPAGATASASFVANLTGVSWNDVYNGYYDGSGNRYLFDEVLAMTAGAITAPKHIAAISAAVLAYLRNASNLNAGTIPAARLLGSDIVTKYEGFDVFTKPPASNPARPAAMNIGGIRYCWLDTSGGTYSVRTPISAGTYYWTLISGTTITHGTGIQDTSIGTAGANGCLIIGRSA